MAMNT